MHKSVADIRNLLNDATSRLTALSDTPRLDAEVLLAHTLERDRAYLFTWPEHQPTVQQVSLFKEYLQQRTDGMPIAYITGEKEFWSMTFRVTADTLVPRPDTETLVQLALDYLSQNPGPVLDLGTGSGAIAVSIAKELEVLPGSLGSLKKMVSATDKSARALDVARENAKQLNADITFYLSDWFKQLPMAKWQLIVSNPPYLDSEDHHLPSLRHEPRGALVAADNGMADISKIILDARNYLADNGCLMIEHGELQGADTSALMKAAGYQSIKTATDIANRARVTMGLLS